MLDDEFSRSKLISTTPPLPQSRGRLGWQGMTPMPTRVFIEGKPIALPTPVTSAEAPNLRPVSNAAMASGKLVRLPILGRIS